MIKNRSSDGQISEAIIERGDYVGITTVGRTTPVGYVIAGGSDAALFGNHRDQETGVLRFTIIFKTQIVSVADWSDLRELHNI